MSDAIICRGSFMLGTACRKCAKCIEEMRDYDTKKKYDAAFNTPILARQEINSLKARIRELEAQAAQSVNVKPLEWRPTVIGGDHLRDVALGLDGLVGYEAGVVENYLLVNGRGLGIKQLGTFETIERAKAAAQADYESRILSALEPATITPAEAAKVLIGGESGTPKVVYDACSNRVKAYKFIAALRAIAGDKETDNET